MNKHYYRLLFSKVHGMLIAAPEYATSSAGKSCRRSTISSLVKIAPAPSLHPLPPKTRIAMAVLFSLGALIPSPSFANLVNVANSSGVNSQVLSGADQIDVGSTQLTAGEDNSDSAFSGVMTFTGNAWESNYGSFVKLGTGTLTIDGANIGSSTPGHNEGEFDVMGGTVAQTSGNTRVASLSVGAAAPGEGTLIVSGGSLDIGTALAVGAFGGSGKVNQTGGNVSSTASCGDASHCGSISLGNKNAGQGEYDISGGSLAFKGGGFFTLGRGGSTGTLNISDSGNVSIEKGSMVLGDNLVPAGITAGSGVLTQTGGALSIANAASLYLTGFGQGTYNLSGGILQVGGHSLMAQYGGGSTLGYAFNLGGGTLQVLDSDLNTSVNATLVEGTTSTIDTHGLAAIWSGTLSGDGALKKTGEGTLTLKGETSWTGDTQIDGGELVLDGSQGGAQLVSNIIGQNNTTLSLHNGATLTGSVDPTNVNIDSTSRWEVTADSFVNDMNLAGTLNFSAPSAQTNATGHTLTVKNWNGQGGTVVLNTVLDDDKSVTDKIVVNGNTQGHTLVRVNNSGGKGASTVEGIEVVQVNGQSDGSFTKSGRIAAGAYDYDLVKKGANWYLSNSYVTPPGAGTNPGNLTVPPANAPVLRPESASYTANLAAANSMFTTRLHDRLGETQYIDALTGEQKATSMWIRQVGGHNSWKDSSGQLSTQANRYVTQMGGEIAQWGSDSLQRWHLGVMAGYGKDNSNSHSKYTGYHSEGSVSGYSAGLYATWYENDETKQGTYVDTWAQYGWFNNDVNGQDIQGESYKSSGVTASAELGYTQKVGEYFGSYGSKNEWFIQPQAQAVWMGVQADDHREGNGTQVSGEGEGNLQTRLGLRTYLKGHSKMDDGKNRSFQPFVEVNWIHNTQNVGTRMDGVSVYQSGAHNTGEVKTGVEGMVSSELNVWGNVGVQVGDKGYNDTSAMVGVKYAFQ